MPESARLGGLAEAEGLGGLTKRPRPAFGPRPTWLFSGALSLTIAYVALAVVLSDPWRSDLEAAIGPIAAWLIPTLLAYIPALIIGFLAFTLILSPYRFPRLQPPSGRWPEGEWPPVTLIIAALNEEEAITPTIERIANLTYPGPIELVLADNNSTDRTAELAEQAAQRLDLRYRRVFEKEAGKYKALNAALAIVTAPLVVSVDADMELVTATLEALVEQPEPIGDELREINVPLLLAKHEGCLGSTDEGFEDIVKAFPEAETAICPEMCASSPTFAEALRTFCERLASAESSLEAPGLPE